MFEDSSFRNRHVPWAGPVAVIVTWKLSLYIVWVSHVTTYDWQTDYPCRLFNPVTWVSANTKRLCSKQVDLAVYWYYLLLAPVIGMSDSLVARTALSHRVDRSSIPCLRRSFTCLFRVLFGIWPVQIDMCVFQTHVPSLTCLVCQKERWSPKRGRYQPPWRNVDTLCQYSCFRYYECNSENRTAYPKFIRKHVNMFFFRSLCPPGRKFLTKPAGITAAPNDTLSRS